MWIIIYLWKKCMTSPPKLHRRWSLLVFEGTKDVRRNDRGCWRWVHGLWGANIRRWRNFEVEKSGHFNHVVTNPSVKLNFSNILKVRSKYGSRFYWKQFCIKLPLVVNRDLKLQVASCNILNNEILTKSFNVDVLKLAVM